jgi:nucleotide-binding universal stress UspA family protein
MFRNILVALDRSPTARRALEEAADLAVALNARLTIISVAPDAPGAAPMAGVDPIAMTHDIETETQRLLREAVESLPDELPVTTVLKHGKPGEQIVEQLKAGQHDLLAMGSRGRGRAAESIFGTTAGYVHWHNRVAMLVIHPEE